MLCLEAEIIRDIVKGMSNRGSPCQKTAVNGGGVRERDWYIERDSWVIFYLGWLRERERERERSGCLMVKGTYG